MTHPDDAPKYGRYGQPEWTPEQIAALKTALMPEPSRDPFGIVLSIIFLTIAALLTWGALNGGWWNLLWVLAGPFALFGVVGLLEDARKHPRDDQGRRIR